MALNVLPLDSDDAKYTIDITLSGILLRYSFYYNGRGDFWTLDVYDTDDNPIVGGIKLVADWELWGQFNDARLPPGPLYCVDTSGQGTDPGADDLGSRVILVYDDGT